MADLRQIVNTELYPLMDKTSKEFKELVAELHRRLKTDGVVLLPDFMTKTSIEQTVLGAIEAAKTAYKSTIEHNVYLEEQDGEAFPAEHPRNLKSLTLKTCIAHDEISDSSPLNTLYRSDIMTDFIRQILGQSVLYRTADPLGALNIQVYNEHDRLGWHFDRGQFAVTLLLQEPHAGGHFEFAPSLRSDEDENYAAVQQILLKSQAGQDVSVDGVKQVSLKPGTLMVFCGHHSLHHVTPVLGNTPRLLAVMSYEKKPGVMLNEYTTKKAFGRLN